MTDEQIEAFRAWAREWNDHMRRCVEGLIAGLRRAAEALIRSMREIVARYFPWLATVLEARHRARIAAASARLARMTARQRKDRLRRMAQRQGRVNPA